MGQSQSHWCELRLNNSNVVVASGKILEKYHASIPDNTKKASFRAHFEIFLFKQRKTRILSK